MAGDIGKKSEKKSDLDVLFDLTPEDDKRLLGSDALLGLVNFGQITEPVKVMGTDGKQHLMDMALLWDEDYVEILKKTTKWSGDPLLRLRIMRRMKLHKAIQHKDDRDYSHPDNPVAQRELWHVLCRMADVQVEFLDGQYSKIELERNIAFNNAIEELIDTLDSTMPDLASAKPADAPEGEAAIPTDAPPVEATEDASETPEEPQKKQPQAPQVKKFDPNDHAAFIQKNLERQQEQKKEDDAKLKKLGEEDTKPPVATASPKQDK